MTAKKNENENQNPPEGDKNQNPPEGDQNQNAKKKEKHLVVVAKRKSFRRAGIDFGEQETRLRVAALCDEQVCMLMNEPMLVVKEVTE